MQLKIKINVSKAPISPPEPAPFDPVKIRNFLLFIVTLLSLIGYGVYSMWTKESKPSLPDTLNSPNSALSNNLVSKNTASNTVKAQQPANISAPPEMFTDTIHAEISKNNIASNKSSAQAKTTNTTLETKITETALTITSDSSAQKTNSTEPVLAAELELAAQKPINVTPTIVNKVEQEKADLFAPTQAINNSVHRAQLTSSIIDREPIDNIEHLNLQEQNKLYLFTEIYGKNNQKIYHRWIFKKKLMAQITLNIKNEQWRTYSSKNFDETMLGQWEVQVVDQNENILKTVMFEVSQ